MALGCLPFKIWLAQIELENDPGMTRQKIRLFGPKIYPTCDGAFELCLLVQCKMKCMVHLITQDHTTNDLL